MTAFDASSEKSLGTPSGHEEHAVPAERAYHAGGLLSIVLVGGFSYADVLESAYVDYPRCGGYE